MEKMADDRLNQALDAWGSRRNTRTAIVIGGSAAMILSGELARATRDCDVIFSDPGNGLLQEDLRAVADSPSLTAGGLNGSVQPYRYPSTG